VFQFNSYERDRWVENQVAQVSAGSRVLDLGAGAGPYKRLFAHCDYVALDSAQVDQDQLCFVSAHVQLSLIADAQLLPFSGSSFDTVLCTEVLEHVPEPIVTVREIGRVLKPGGRLILTAPLGSGLHQEPFHFYGGYTPHWYYKFLTEAGFENIIIEANGGFFKHYGQESLRFALLMAPWRGGGQLVWFPMWLLTLPWFGLICPLLGHFLDRLDRDRAFTVGYHVTAVRCS
jgi:SAM-dependent methyltransferase